MELGTFLVKMNICPPEALMKEVTVLIKPPNNIFYISQYIRDKLLLMASFSLLVSWY